MGLNRETLYLVKPYLFVALILTLAVIVTRMGVIPYMDPTNIGPDPERVTQRITEDDPRWDCRTMGNRRCGPDSKARPGGGYW